MQTECVARYPPLDPLLRGHPFGVPFVQPGWSVGSLGLTPVSPSRESGHPTARFSTSCSGRSTSIESKRNRVGLSSKSARKPQDGTACVSLHQVVDARPTSNPAPDSPPGPRRVPSELVSLSRPVHLSGAGPERFDPGGEFLRLALQVEKSSFQSSRVDSGGSHDVIA